MSSSLSGNVALVTGGSKGTGASHVLRLADLGAGVATNYSSDAQAADDVVAQINENSNGAAFKAVAGSVDGVDMLVQDVIEKFGKMYLLVTNAGILPTKDLASTSESDLDKAYALKVKGPYFLAQLCSHADRKCFLGT